jgi:uncharacterized coiled-coil protein SlyX
MDDQARFESLEIKAMQLEDALAALSDACARQQRELAELRQRLQGLVERLAADDAPQGASATAHEPPPHY